MALKDIVAQRKRGLLDAIAGAERSFGDYGAVNPGTDDTALGRYQLMEPAIIDAGMKDRVGRWTGRQGIFGENDFLNDPVAQDQAMQDYFDMLEGQLTDKGAWDKIGQEIRGVKATFQITPQGLLAAAHRQGADAVRRYLDHLAQRGWASDVDTLGNTTEATTYRRIETRLRSFETVPYR